MPSTAETPIIMSQTASHPNIRFAFSIRNPRLLCLSLKSPARTEGGRSEAGTEQPDAARSVPAAGPVPTYPVCHSGNQRSCSPSASHLPQTWPFPQASELPVSCTNTARRGAKLFRHASASSAAKTKSHGTSSVEKHSSVPCQPLAHCKCLHWAVRNETVGFKKNNKE